MNRHLVIIVASAIAASAAAQQERGVILRIESARDVAVLEAPFVIDAQLVKDDGFGPPQPFKCPANGDCEIPLRQGTWVLSSGDGRVYVDPRSVEVTVEQTAPPIVSLRLHRASKVVGQIKEPTAVTRITVAFSGREPNALSGRAKCTIENDRFACMMPAGAWDLRIGAPDHVPQYRWAVDVRPEVGKSLGELRFKRGASLSGRVEIERGLRLKNVEEMRVTVVPTAAFRDVQQERHASRSARIQRNGFFQFEGLPAGEYRIVATAEGAASESQVVRVIEYREAELRKPLLLARPRTITVSMLPFWDPAGKPWRVRLRKRGADGRFDRLAESAVDEIGQWRHLNAWPGSYELSVLDQHDSTWMSRDFELDTDIDLLLRVEPMPLTGELKMGNRSISAMIYFRSPSGTDIRFAADDDGKFSGFLIAGRETPWTVRIESQELAIERELRNVKPAYTADGRAHVTLTLPSGHLGGQVVDADGKPIAVGLVDITSTQSTEHAQIRVETDGRFAANGLAPGDYSVQARAVVEQQPAVSDVVAVTIDEEPRDDLILKVRPERIVRGIVLSQGMPVVGAQVIITPADRNWISIGRRTTDASGRFQTLVPPGTSEVDILVKAPAFATRLFHTKLTEEDLVVRMAQTGGELRLALPSWNPEDPVAPQPWVIHDGAIVHARSIGEERWDERSVTFSSPQIDPGVYTVCIASIHQLVRLRSGDFGGAKCVSRMVPPFGRVEIDWRNEPAR